jgi:hypothetical protein
LLLEQRASFQSGSRHGGNREEPRIEVLLIYGAMMNGSLLQDAISLEEHGSHGSLTCGRILSLMGILAWCDISAVKKLPNTKVANASRLYWSGLNALARISGTAKSRRKRGDIRER